VLQQEKLRAEFDQLKKLVSLAGVGRSWSLCGCPRSWVAQAALWQPAHVFNSTCLLTRTACLPCLPALPACLQDDPIQIERALERGEARLREHLHPDPYIGQ
jgi:hypothetical protein